MCGVLWSYKRSICLSGGAYLSNWVCVWSQRRGSCTICLSDGGGRLSEGYTGGLRASVDGPRNVLKVSVVVLVV